MHLPSERSVCLTDAECQGKFLLDTECPCKCCTDDVRHGICLLDEECPCICLLNAARVLQIQNVKANVFQTMHAMASTIQTRSVSAFAFWT